MSIKYWHELIVGNPNEWQLFKPSRAVQSISTKETLVALPLRNLLTKSEFGSTSNITLGNSIFSSDFIRSAISLINRATA